MAKTSKIKLHPRGKPREQSAGKVQVSLNCELPDAEEFLELALQARKWRLLVQDLILLLTRWRDTATNAHERPAYENVLSMLRYNLGALGLTTHTHVQQEKFHRQNLKEYSRYLDVMIEKGKAFERDMKAEDELMEKEILQAKAT